MPICPHCSYKLVLLSRRPKYKCALCSRLYSQKLIDNKEFQEWNLRERKSDRHLFIKEELDKLKQKEWSNLMKGFRFLFRFKTKNVRKYKGVLLTKEEKLERKSQYYFNNRENELLRNKIYRQNNLEKTNARKKHWCKSNALITSRYNLVQHYRQRQKALALQYLENDTKKAQIDKIFTSVSTWLLADLRVF